jgi:hypothetical protein
MTTHTRHVESGDGWRVSGYFRDGGDGKYRVEITHPSGTLKPYEVDKLIEGLRRTQVALRDRLHPDTVKLRALENSQH